MILLEILSPTLAGDGCFSLLVVDYSYIPSSEITRKLRNSRFLSIIFSVPLEALLSSVLRD